MRPEQNGRHVANVIFKCIPQQKFSNLFSNSIEVCSLWYNYQYVGVGSGDGLMAVRHQSIMWTDEGLIHSIVLKECYKRGSTL